MSTGGAARTEPSLHPPSILTNNDHPTEQAIILLQIKDDIPDIFSTLAVDYRVYFGDLPHCQELSCYCRFFLCKSYGAKCYFPTVYHHSLKEIQVHDLDNDFSPAHMQWRCSGDTMILLNKNINLHIISSLQALNNWKSSSYIICHDFLSLSSMQEVHS